MSLENSIGAATKVKTDHTVPAALRTNGVQPKQSWIYRFVIGFLKGLTLAISLSTQLTCALIISQYSSSHSGKGEERMDRFLSTYMSTYWTGRDSTSLKGEDSSMESSSKSPFNVARLPIAKSIDGLYSLSVPNFIIDPSASTFINAIMMYCAAVLLYYNMGNDNQHQDYFLAFGALSGILVGTLASWSDSSLDALKDYIPISITAALTLSLVWHALLSWIATPPKIGQSDLR